MSIHDELGIRMKTFYEEIPKTKLMRRCTVVLRIDGKAFHTFTRGFQKPFDEVLIKSMQETTKYLCENIQGCVLGYTQSDEISLVLIDYNKLNSSAWFDYEVQKMCSIAASMTTMVFNKYFSKYANLKARQIESEKFYCGINDNTEEFIKKGKEYRKLADTYRKSIENGAMFDTRCFNIPKEEVTNYIYWRQLDATRNSIQMVGQANFPHKELQNKSCNDIQDMLMTQKGINWNNLPTYQKRGSCVVKEKYCTDNNVMRSRWIIDKKIPIFKSEGREYIEKLIMVGE